MRRPRPRRRAETWAAGAGCVLLLLIASGLRARPDELAPRRAAGGDPGEGLVAFGEIAQVLRHPRCLNCHTTTSFPRQGDDRHPHANLVRRGPEDRGVPGMACGTCHQAENDPASGVPGKPGWRLAPLSMGWEGLADGELCRLLKDPGRNGGRDLAALARHVESDPLVAYGWDPGGSRRPVPVPRERLVRLMQTWARAGAPCPAAGGAGTAGTAAGAD
jgi:hypothetical protein